MKVEVFAKGEASLGEGPLWHPQRQSLFWLDINNQRLFEKVFISSNKQPDREWELPEMASALAIDKVDDTHLWMVTDCSFGRFSMMTGTYEPKIKLDFPTGIRSNDGSVAPNGSFWFGTMERKPTGLHGSVYVISQEAQLTKVISRIGIPNAFCWSNDGMSFYLSDSYRQQIIIYRSNESDAYEYQTIQPFIDLSNTNTAPDGAAMDQAGNIWNSQWDGFKVACYSPEGEEINILNLPIPRPTSCCFGGKKNNHLFITTAKEGLSDEELAQYPLSGSVFVVKLPVEGQPISSFSMKG